jgi:hypothetical protein
MADGPFIINYRNQAFDTPSPPVAWPMELARSPAPTVCTPDDPFGRGSQGAAFATPSLHSKSELELRAQQEKSAADLGSSIIGPVLKIAERVGPRGALKLAIETYKAGKTLSESGTEGLAAKQLRDLAIKQAAKEVEKKLALPPGTGNLLGKAFKDVLKGGGSTAPSPAPAARESEPLPPPPTAVPKPPRDPSDRVGTNWASRRPDREKQDQIQQGVDRRDDKARKGDGTMVA